MVPRRDSKWTCEEDNMLIHLVHVYGVGKWAEIARVLHNRNGKQCRERYVNHLDPNINKAPMNEHEDRIIIQQQKILGNKWTKIAAMLPGRTPNQVKNHWYGTNRRIKRRHDDALYDVGDHKGSNVVDSSSFRLLDNGSSVNRVEKDAVVGNGGGGGFGNGGNGQDKLRLLYIAAKKVLAENEHSF